MTLGEYAWYDHNWKSPKRHFEEYNLYHLARGGTYMLNVGGPPPDAAVSVRGARESLSSFGEEWIGRISSW